VQKANNLRFLKKVRGYPDQADAICRLKLWWQSAGQRATEILEEEST